MKPTVGFILVTYSQPQQTLGLCRKLGEMFGDPPIAVHHDFSQCALDTSAFPPFVSFVKQWRRTGWGSMSVVNGQLAAMRLLQEKADPDWCTNLSSSDYPIQTAERILEDLRTPGIDAFWVLRPVEDQGQKFLNEGLGELTFDHPRYAQSAFNRYVAIPLLSPKMARKLRQPCEAWVLKSRALIKRWTPFDGSLRCFGGDAWFTANRRVLRVLLEPTPLWQRLYAHFRSRSIPEESFYHTLLGNTPGLRLATDNLRYTDWRGCYAHPRILGREDFPRLLRSTHHFARKFAFDPELFADLDAAVTAKPVPQRQWRPNPGTGAFTLYTADYALP